MISLDVHNPFITLRKDMICVSGQFQGFPEVPEFFYFQSLYEPPHINCSIRMLPPRPKECTLWKLRLLHNKGSHKAKSLG